MGPLKWALKPNRRSPTLVHLGATDLRPAARMIVAPGGGGGPVFADHLRARAPRALEEEVVEFVAAEAVGWFGQNIADHARTEVEVHLAQDRRAKFEKSRLAARAAEKGEDAGREEFATDLVPGEDGLFENPDSSARSYGCERGHRTGGTSAYHMHRPHEDPSCL